MQLTKFSDYALRVLMYVHAAGDRRVTTDEMAAAYRISRAHLMKVANSLTRAGYLTALRVLDQHTLANVALRPRDFRAVFQTARRPTSSRRPTASQRPKAVADNSPPEVGTKHGR